MSSRSWPRFNCLRARAPSRVSGLGASLGSPASSEEEALAGLGTAGLTERTLPCLSAALASLGKACPLTWVASF